MTDRSEGGPPAGDVSIRVNPDYGDPIVVTGSRATARCLIEAFRQRGYEAEEIGCSNLSPVAAIIPGTPTVTACPAD